MNSIFVVISTLVKSNIEEKCLTKFLMNVSTKGLKDYLECASIYKGTSFKRKMLSYTRNQVRFYL